VVAVNETVCIDGSNPGASTLRVTEPAGTASKENVPSTPVRVVRAAVPGLFNVTTAPLIVPPRGSVTRPSSATV
jgi:hypothetical protein